MKALFFLRRRLSMQRLHGYLFLEIKIRPCLCNDRSKKRKKVVDSLAATIILQSYLNGLKK